VNALYIKLLIGAVLFGAWLALVFNPQSHDDAIITFIQFTLGGLAGHLATPTSKDTP
jgi:hypothetical protein